MLDPLRGLAQRRLDPFVPGLVATRPLGVVLDHLDGVAVAFAALRHREAGPDLWHDGPAKRKPFRLWQLMGRQPTWSGHERVQVDHRRPWTLRLTQPAPRRQRI